MTSEIQPVQIFIAYSHRDRTYLDELRVHAAPLTRNHRLRIWFDGEIRPGEVWDNSIKENLHAAHIILLLVSANALHSDYFYEKEVRDALERHALGQARVVPVLLAPCLWDETPLADLQGLPDGMKAISAWPDRDAAWENVLRGIRRIIGEMERKEPPAAAPRNDAPAPAAKVNPADEVLWKIARKNNSRAAYQGYLDKMPLGLHAGEARDLLDHLDADDALWDYANAPGTQSTLESNLADYLETFPAGLHAAEAQEILNNFAREREDAERRRQAEAADQADWQAAEKTNTEAAYKKYLQQHPDGLHAAAAKKKVVAYEQARQEAARKKLAEVEAEWKRREEAARLEAEKLEKRDPFHGLMIPIKGGTFDMGSNEVVTEKPIHKVTVPDFQLCKYPVTQAQWKAIMGNNPSHFRGDDLPVENVSWDEVQAFLKKLNALLPAGQKPYRLPTEAEWEYAARGGNRSKGYPYAGSDNLDEVAWYSGNSGSKTHPVGGKKANELSLFDMSGNVWECCADNWHNDYKDAPTDGSAWVDESANSAVLRGGSWGSDDSLCRVARRSWDSRVNRNNRIGFRLARAAAEGGR